MANIWWKKNQIIFYFLLGIALIMLYTVYKQWALKKSFAITAARIDDYRNFRGGGTASFTFTFVVAGVSYNGSSGISCNRKDDLAFLLLKRDLDVAYEKDDPGNCQLLYSKEMYSRFNAKPSEDILWIIDSVKAICEH